MTNRNSDAAGHDDKSSVSWDLEPAHTTRCDDGDADSLVAPKHIVYGFAGVIGVGKTTLAKRLGKYLGYPVYFELDGDNTLLGLFYKDQARYAFSLEMALLLKRYKQQESIPGNGILDRCIYDDIVFVRMLHKRGQISDYDFATYKGIASIVMQNLRKKLKAIIFLDTTPAEALRRIHDRGIASEQNISIDYLQELYDEYQHWVNEISLYIPVIRIDWSHFIEDIDPVATAIVNETKQLQTVRVIRLTANNGIRESPPLSSSTFQAS